MARSCSLNTDALKALRQKVYADVMDQINANESVDLKNYIKSVYELIYSSTDSELQALDVASMIPTFVNQLQAADDIFAEGIGTDTAIEALQLRKDFLAEDGLKNVRDYLGIQKESVGKKLEILNKNQLEINFEQPKETKQKQSREEILEEDSRERREGIDEWYDERQERLAEEEKKVSKTATAAEEEVVEEATTEQTKAPQPEPVYIVDDPRELSELIGDSIMQDVNNSEDYRAYKYTDQLQEIGKDLDSGKITAKMGSFRAIIDNRAVVDFITSDGRRFFMYKSTGKGTTADTKGLWAPIPGFAKNGWFIKVWDKNGVDPKKSKYGVKTFFAIEEYLTKNEDAIFNPGAEQNVKPELPIEKATVNPSAPTALASVTEKVKKRILDLWNAFAPTFLSTTGLETVSYKDSDQKDYRVEDATTALQYKAQRKLIELFYGDTINETSENLEIEGVGTGVYLRAVRSENTETLQQASKYDKDAVSIQVVDAYGRPIRITKNLSFNMSEGTAVEFNLRTPNLKNYTIDQMVRAAHTYNYPGKNFVKNSPEALALEQQIKSEIEQIKQIRKYLKENPGEDLLFTIKGGSMGHINTNTSLTTKVSQVTEKLKFEVFETSNPVLGIKAGNTYVTADNLYGQQIQVERPGVAESADLELIKQLLFEDVQSESGGSISVTERMDILQNYIDAKNEIDTYKADDLRVHVVPVSEQESAAGYKLLVSTINPTTGQKSEELYDVTDPKQKAAAIEAFDTLLNVSKDYNQVWGGHFKSHPKYKRVSDKTNAKPGEFYDNGTKDNKGTSNYTRVGYAFKSITSSGAINTGVVKTGTITQNANGDLVLTKKNVPVQEFLASQQFEIATPEISADGKLKRLNSYFTFQLTDSASNKLKEKSPAQEAVEQEEINQRDESVNEDAAEKGHNSESKPASSKKDRFKDMFGKDNDEQLFRSLDQSGMTKKEVQKKIDEAREWYEKSPLNDIFPFEPMFDKVNKEGVAQWTMAGVTLYKGSDFTDLYHEAWHGFTQGFLTLEQKRELYDEVKRKRGTFRDYNGKQVSFEDASDKQIEEYLAEEFRSYMLKGGKEGKKKLGTKTKSFFQKLLNMLEYLFTDSSYNEIYSTPEANVKVEELFEKLRLGNLSEHSFSYDNAMFGKLNAGITALKDVKGVNQLNYQDSIDIAEMIDYYIADFAILKSSTQLDKEKLSEIESQLRNPDLTEKQKKDLTAKKDAIRNQAKYLGAVTKSPKLMAQAYQWAKSELSILKDDINKKYLAETNENEKARLFKQKQTLEFALEHFGDTENLNNNISKEGEVVRGVMGYHMSKTALFQSDTLLDYENVPEDQKYSNQLYSQPGNAMSLYEMAKPEVIFLLKSLPDVKDGIEAKNKYGVTKLAPFNATWNRLARALQNTHDITDMYQKLNDLAKTYEPIKSLVERLGDPANASLIDEVNLQSAFFQTFAKTRVPLVQMTLANEKGSWQARVGEAFNSDYAIGRRWQNNLSTAIPNTNDYILTDSKGKNYVNIDLLLKNFTEGNLGTATERINFYNALGFTLTDTPEIKREITQKKYDPTYFRKALAEMQKSKERLYDYRELTDNERPKYKALMELEAKYSDVFSNFAVTNAEGNMQYEHTLNNSMTIMINSINNAVNYDALINQPHMSHLNIERNDFAKASLWMKSLFDLSGTRSTNPNYGNPKINPKTGERVTLKLMNLSGVLVQENVDSPGEGVSSASADKFTKMLMDLHLAQAGGFELMRHADKGTSYAVKIDGLIEGNTDARDSYIPMSMFADQVAYQNLTYERVLPHLIAEMNRMRKMKTLASEIERGEQVAYDYKYIKDGQQFVTFGNVLKSQTDLKTRLEEIVNGNQNIEETLRADQALQNDIKLNLNEYFEIQFKNMKKDFNEAGYLADNLVDNVSKRYPRLKGQEKDALIKSFVHNNWIHNIESVSLLYGDLALYNHAKEEFHKRNAGIGSTGTIYRTDQSIQNYINNNLWESSYAKKLGLEKRDYNGQFNTAILEDQSVVSAYFEEYSKKDQLGEAAADYGKGQNEGDAQGLISFDSYRQLKVAEGTWSNAQEKLYRDVVSGKTIRPQDVIKFFPVIKAQYWGPLADKTNLPITAFHKYSLFPLIPGVIEGTNAEIIHEKMMKEGIDYVTFESGSKVGNITKTGDVKTGERNFDKAYTNPQSRLLRDELKEDQTDDKGQYIPYFTKNTIYLEYLKNQLNIHDEPKGKTIFSTQLRKLIEDGLMENGIPKDLTAANKTKWQSLKSEKAKEEASPYYKMLRTYERNLEKLTAIAKEELLEEMNWTSEMVNGEEVLNGKIENLISFVQKELDRRDLAQHEIEFLQFNEKGELKHDLSKHTSVQEIEKVLNALMVKKLITQKVNGEGLIQVASSFMEKVADQEGRDFNNPTEEDLKNYGSNDLPFYRKGKGPNGTTSAMKVKVSLQGNFEHLLKLKDKEGNIIGNRKKLNDLIKDEEWLNTGRNREMITMVAVRIPVQGLNSMEFMEVYEFLDPSAGSVIIPPTEIVTKSGADFDVDKMTVMMPNIRKAKYKKNEFGISEQISEPQMWNWTEAELKEEYDRYLEAQKEIVKGGEDAATDNLLMSIFGTLDVDQMVEEEIEQLKKEGKVMDYAAFKKKRMGSKAVQNDLIKNIRDILSLNSNFKPLLTPNSTDLLYDASDSNSLAMKFKDTAMDFNPGENLYGDGTVKKGVSATRVLEYRYNLYKHQSNKIGKEALGLGAVDNTYNSLFNRIGAYMNHATVSKEELAKAEATLKDKDATPAQKKAARNLKNKYEVQTILLDHNTLNVKGEKVISLSHLKSKDGVSISDSINQMINGWVDVAKDAWIFNIQGNKEVAPTLLFMIQAGVPLQDAVTLASSPLVKEYIKEQQLLKSTFAKPLGFELKNANQFRTQARTNILSKPKYGFNLKATGENKQVSLGSIKETTEQYLKGVTKLNTEALFKNTGLHSKAKKEDKPYNYTVEDQQAFLHYLQLENMGKSVRDVKMRTNVDTSKDDSLFAAQDRLGMIQALREDGRLPESIVDGIMDKSPISSFFIQSFQINLLGRLFPIRNHKSINQFVRTYVDKQLQDNTYGDKQITVNNWKSDLINFMFQNELKYFNVDKINSYKSLRLNDTVKLEPAKIRFGAYVKEGRMFFDKNTLIQQFNDKAYSKQSYNSELGLAKVTGSDVFNDANEYIHFVLERESLRAQKPLNSIKDTVAFNYYKEQYESLYPQTTDESSQVYNKRLIKNAYEIYLRDTAMHNISNFNYMFKHSTANYANKFSLIKKAYPELAKTFDLFTALSTTEKGGIKNIMLNSSKLTGDQKNILHENLNNLSNVVKLKEVLPETSLEQRTEIAEFFKSIPAYAFMQSGMNIKSNYSINQVVSQDQMLAVLEKPTKALLDKLDNDPDALTNYMDLYTQMFGTLNASSARKTRIRGKNYFKNVTLNDLASVKSKPKQSLLEEGFQTIQQAAPTTQPQAAEKKTYTGMVTSLEPNQIFVFGSNPEGRHGAGAAKYAADNFGAVMGQGKGIQGQSYALPTKDLRVKTNKGLRSIPKEEIINNIKDLYYVAEQLGHKEFLVSDYSGKNLNGYTGQEMAEMFHQAGPIPANVIFNENFQKLIPTTKLETVAKEGINFVYEQNPELAEIGTPEEYTEYLDTVFPKSKIKDVLFRGSTNPNKTEASELDPEKGTGAKNLAKGIYMAKSKEKADGYSGKEGRTQAYIVNAEDFYITSINKNWQRSYNTPTNLTVNQFTKGKDTVINFEYLDKDNYVDRKDSDYIGEYVGPTNVNGFPTYQENVNQMPYWTELAVQSNEQLLALGSEKDVQMFREYMKSKQASATTQQTGVEYKARTYNTSRLTGAATAKALMEQADPGTSFVYNGPIENVTGGRVGDELLHDTNAQNTINLTTKQTYSQTSKTQPVRADIIRDVDGRIDPKVKEAIDNSIENIKEHIAQGQEIAFSDKGYGQDMLQSNASNNQYAPQTFLYLSEQLYKNFGYVNPGYLSSNANSQVVRENYAKIQEDQNISDLEITEALDLEVMEFMKNCI